MAKLTFKSDPSEKIRFHKNGSLSLNFNSAAGKTVYLGQEMVRRGTTEYWNSQPELVSDEDIFYLYDDGHDTPIRIKVGDGKAFLIDMPFLDDAIAEHIQDDTIHITEIERESWNNKVRCFVDNDDAEHLIFTTK